MFCLNLKRMFELSRSDQPEESAARTHAGSSNIPWPDRRTATARVCLCASRRIGVLWAARSHLARLQIGR